MEVEENGQRTKSEFRHREKRKLTEGILLTRITLDFPPFLFRQILTKIFENDASSSFCGKERVCR